MRRQNRKPKQGTIGRYPYKRHIRYGSILMAAALSLAVSLLSGCQSPVPQLQQASLLPAGQSDAENLAGLWQDNASGTMVQIVSGDHVGSGVLWQQEGECLYIATAGHVIDGNADKIEIRFVDGWVTEAEEYALCEQADLAFVSVNMRGIDAEQAAGYLLTTGSSETYAKRQAGDRIILMASAGGVAKEAYEGSLLDPWIYMEDFEQYMIYLKVPAYPGMSGGGVFDAEGYLMGIFCGAARQEGELSEAAAVPLGIIQTEFEKYRENR